MPEPLTTLPGAEFAPVVTRTRHGLRPATADEVQAIERREACGVYGVLTAIEDGHEIAVWRLSCTDADDRRAIWWRAALQLGASESEASRAVMILRHGGRQLEIVGPGERVLWCASMNDSWGSHLCTAALCARVWGPR